MATLIRKRQLKIENFIEVEANRDFVQNKVAIDEARQKQEVKKENYVQV